MRRLFALFTIFIPLFVSAQFDTTDVLEVVKSHATKVTVAPPERVVKYSSFLDRNKAICLNIGYNNSSSLWGKKPSYVHGVNGISVGISAYGVYVSLAMNTEGAHHSNMGVDLYDGYNTAAYHIGYTLPISDWLSITPVIGYSYWQSGYYDGSDYTVDRYGVHNKFIAEFSHSAFDYGAIVNFTLWKYVNVFFNITSNNIGGGLGARIPFDVFR